MLAIIGSSPIANSLASFLAPHRRVLRVPSPDGSSAQPRLESLAVIAGAGVTLALAATGSDERSLFAAAAAKAHGAATSAAIVESHTLAEGAPLAPDVDHLIEPSSEFALAIVSLALGPVASAVRALGAGRVRVLELTIPPDWCGNGKPLQDLGLPGGARVALIRRGEWAIAPSATAQLQGGDRVLLVANREVADAAASCLGAAGPGGPRVLVLSRDTARAALIAQLLSRADITADAAEPTSNAAPRAAEFVVLLDADPRHQALARALCPGARIIAAGGAPASGKNDAMTLTPFEAVGLAVLNLLPRPPVQRVGTIAPGELDVYRAEAGKSGRWLGVPLRELKALRGWTVLAIRAGRGVHLPHPEDAIEPREVLILAGPPGAQDVLLRGLRGK